MNNEEEGGSSRDWVRLLREGNLSGQDLYNLVDDVITAEIRENPPERPAFIDPERWNPDEVYLDWSEGLIDLKHDDPEDNSYKAINANIAFGKRRHSIIEYYQLREYPDGIVKLFIVRSEPTRSELFNETLEEEYLEVPLNPARIKRIGQVVLFAHVRRMVGA